MLHYIGKGLQSLLTFPRTEASTFSTIKDWVRRQHKAQKNKVRQGGQGLEIQVVRLFTSEFTTDITITSCFSSTSSGTKTFPILHVKLHELFSTNEAHKSPLICIYYQKQTDIQLDASLHPNKATSFPHLKPKCKIQLGCIEWLYLYEDTVLIMIQLS